nr:MAG TPA: acetyltransferase domain containing protein [Caudoviricetes sp.]
MSFYPEYRHKGLKTRVINSKKHRDLSVLFWYYRGSNR